MSQVIAVVVDFFATYVFAEGARAFVIRTLLTIGISTMIAKRQMTGFGQSDAGARLQLAPATDNLLPVVYGKAFIRPTITDAKISNDNKTMWYCCTLSEVPQGSTVNFGKIYWNGAEVNGVTGTSSIRSTVLLKSLSSLMALLEIKLMVTLEQQLLFKLCQMRQYQTI